jgi:hypothetical protein
MIDLEIINLIQTIGFPAVMVLWFMFRTEKTIKANTEALYSVSAVLNLLKK